MPNHSIRNLLNIPEYKIAEVKNKTETEIHIRVEPYKRNRGICSGCGQKHGGLHSTREMVAEDLPLGNRRVFLYIPKRRYKCHVDGRIHTEEIPWIEMGARTTKAFARRVYQLTAITTNEEAGWYLGLNDEKVYRIDKAMLENYAKKHLEPIPVSSKISVDEVAWQKHHRYLTNVVDIDKKVVTWNQKGRKAEVLDEYYGLLGEDNCQKIEMVALDGARTYIQSTKDHAANASIVLDHFHVVQKVNNTADQVRKDELRKARKAGNKELVQLVNCKQRFILLKNRKKLSTRQSSNLERLCRINRPIYKALLLKESFLQVYDLKNAEEAETHIYEWVEEAFKSGLEPFIDLAWSILDKIQYILNWFIYKISSAISEGLNNKIKRLKRMAYGYKDIHYFRLKIHQHCGYLNPRKFQLK